MDRKELITFWKASFQAAKIISDGAFPHSEDEFIATCDEQLHHLPAQTLPSIESANGEAGTLLKEIARRIFGFFVELARTPEQETRFNEIIAELDQCKTPDDYEEFKISLNIFLNFFRSVLSEMDEDRGSLKDLLEDLDESLPMLKMTGQSFIQVVDDFKKELGNIKNTKMMEDMLLFLVSHCDRIHERGVDLQQDLVNSQERLTRVQQKLEKLHRAGTGPKDQIIEAKAFRERFRYMLQSTLYQRENISLILFRIVNLDDLEKHVGREMTMRILRNVVVTFARQVGKNDLITRLDRDMVALLLLNTPLDAAQKIGESLASAIDKLKFSCHGVSYQVKGTIGIACCNLQDTMETVTRKALLSLELGSGGEKPAVLTERDIPKELLETIYTI